MNYKCTAVFLWAALFLFGALAGAKNVGGTIVPQTLRMNNEVLQLNGAGIREKYLVDVYVGALYLSKKSSEIAQILNSKENKCITMRTLVHLSKGTMEAAILNGIIKNVSEDEFESIQSDIDTFNSFFVEIEKNSTIQINFLADGETELYINHRKKGGVNGYAFQKALLSVWLGDKPPTEAIKTAMLGGE